LINVGDTIQVEIRGSDSGVNMGDGGASISIGAGASMSVPGTIIKDLGNRWLVRLSMSVGNADTIEVPKSN